MKHTSTPTRLRCLLQGPPQGSRCRLAALACTALSAMLLAGCAIEFQNLQAREQLAREQQPAASLYSGWRVFQERCANCHGAGGDGTAAAPDLLQSVRTMGPRRFVGLVLSRYDLFPPGAIGNGAARDAWIDEALLRRQGSMNMPAWQGEPAVTVHVADLYAWLSARAEGRLAPGRPR
jgi:mono/diheme cytochrome c family protein